jgi:hypothetical protein
MTVRVVLRKYDGSPHRHQTMRRLGEDEHGVWLWAPAGNPVYLGDGSGSFDAAHLAVRLIPTGGRWWSALFCPAPANPAVYCDIVTPPEWSTAGEVAMVDLDLDVCRYQDGRVQIHDEDEFITHRFAYAYPEPVVSRALDAADDVWHALAGDTEPFAGVYKCWLDRVPTSAA